MANNGTYGIKKPAYITSSDVDIFYHYRPSRSTDSSEFTAFKKLDSNVLSNVNVEEVEGSRNETTLPGMYNLKLPVNKFGAPGIYTIYIKPKEYNATILDVSTLAGYSNIRGIVIDTTTVSDQSIFNNGNLVGYRIDYFEDGKRLDMSRIITSSNRCEPVAQNMNDSSGNGVKYILNSSSNLVFCTVTPSVSMQFESNNNPSIGSSGQAIRIVSTKFNPVCMEIEMTEHDIEDVSTMLEGNQIRNLENGLITTFNNDGEIYHQASYGHIVNTSGAENLNADFKVKNDETSIIISEKDKMNKVKEQLQ